MYVNRCPPDISPCDVSVRAHLRRWRRCTAVTKLIVVLNGRHPRADVINTLIYAFLYICFILTTLHMREALPLSLPAVPFFSPSLPRREHGVGDEGNFK